MQFFVEDGRALWGDPELAVKVGRTFQLSNWLQISRITAAYGSAPFKELSNLKYLAFLIVESFAIQYAQRLWIASSIPRIYTAIYTCRPTARNEETKELKTVISDQQVQKNRAFSKSV